MYKAALALLLAVLCLCGATAASAETQTTVVLLGSTYTGFASAFTQAGVAPSQSAASRLCTDRGGVLPTDRAGNARAQLEQLSVLTSCSPGMISGTPATPYTTCVGFYTAGTAAPTNPGGSCATTERVRELTANGGQDTLTDSGWDTGCNYRWSVGWYDRFTYAGQPGTGIWKSTWAHVDLTLPNIRSWDLAWQNVYTNSVYKDGALNGYTTEFLWNYTHQCAPTDSIYNPACVPPHGYFYLMAGKRRFGLTGDGYTVRVDVPNAVAEGYPFAENNIVLVCEHQGVETDYYRSTTAQPQPVFRQGWKEETWAQKNWWVIFLIVAIIILALIFAIAIYCLCTRRPQPTGPLLHSLVVRERDGRGYIVVDDEEDDMAAVNKNPLDNGYAQRGMPQQPQPQMPYPAGGGAGQGPVRSGFGFNHNTPQHDDPANYMAPGFYKNGNNNAQYNPNGGNESQMPGALAMDMPGYSTEPPPPEPEEPEAAQGEDELSKAPSVLSRRRSSRRGKGRAASQTFSEVDLPQAGEIGEDNVEL